MRRIVKIAKAELSYLFYSPVAWLILVAFTVQMGLKFTAMMADFVYNQDMQVPLGFLTGSLLGGPSGVYNTVQQYLYLYLPLLTMGLMSKEYSSGTIKLLYSSPVTSFQIIMGKFSAMMTYGLVLLGTIILYLIFGACVIDNFCLPEALAGLLGLYLLLCAYAAIGLFVSTLTSYQVAAGIGTLILLAVLNYMDQVWQTVEFVRDITYWLCLSGRTAEMINGLICSEDVLYFVLVIVMFLSLSIIKLEANRRKMGAAKLCVRYVGVVALTMLLGYISSRPACMGFYDTTETKRNSLTTGNQEIMKKLDGKMTITTYVNFLDNDYRLGMPANMNYDKERFKRFLRFKPDIKMKYVYYYDSTANPWLDQRFPNLGVKERAQELADMRKEDLRMFLPPEEIRKVIDLSAEGNRFIRVVERENGQKAFLRLFDDIMKLPGEAEIAVTMKRFVMKLPTVGFLTGHGERSKDSQRPRDYHIFSERKNFRNSLVNQGFDVENINLSTGDIPQDMEILVLADLTSPLSDQEKAKLEEYIAQGGNLLILCDVGHQEIMNDLTRSLGVTFEPGTLVQAKEDLPANVILAKGTRQACEMSYLLDHHFGTRKGRIVMEGACGLSYTRDKGFEVAEWLVTEEEAGPCWNEMETRDFVNDTAVCNPAAGEAARTYPLALALTRKVNAKSQRILILSDADCISNNEFSIKRNISLYTPNYAMVTGGFFWLSDGKAPLDMRRPNGTDTSLRLSRKATPYLKAFWLGILPVSLLLFGLILCMRRKGR